MVRPPPPDMTRPRSATHSEMNHYFLFFYLQSLLFCYLKRSFGPGIYRSLSLMRTAFILLPFLFICYNYYILLLLLNDYFYYNYFTFFRLYFILIFLCFSISRNIDLLLYYNGYCIIIIILYSYCYHKLQLYLRNCILFIMIF